MGESEGFQAAKKKKIASAIVKTLRLRGFAAYFVGGCVRDMLMRKLPKDIDIATDAKVNQIKKIFPRKTHSVGVQFGTLLVVRNNIPFQVSTFRNKSKNSSFALLEDLRGRDFTINGLAYDPLKKEIIDFVGAKADIRKKKLRAIGEPCAKFKQDPLRLIRAIRFAVSYGFNIEDRTYRAIKKMAKNINKASKERIRDELVLIFTSRNPARGLALLDQCGLLKYILPDLDKLKGVKQPQAFHPEGDVFVHTLLMLEQLKRPSQVLVFACLFHDIGKPATFQVAERIRFSRHDKVGAEITEGILKEFRFSNKERQDIVACVQNHMRMMEAPKMRDATLKRLFARATFEQELKLHYLDCIASHRDLKVWRFLTKRYEQFKESPVIPKPLLNGNELIKIGFTPGPIFGKIHRQMVDLQLEGKLKNKSEAKRWLLKKFKEKDE